MTEKRLTFSQDVITQQNDKENVSDLASCLERTIVSPNTYLRARGPPQYGETMVRSRHDARSDTFSLSFCWVMTSWLKVRRFSVMVVWRSAR